MKRLIFKPKRETLRWSRHEKHSIFSVLKYTSKFFTYSILCWLLLERNVSSPQWGEDTIVTRLRGSARKARWRTQHPLANVSAQTTGKDKHVVTPVRTVLHFTSCQKVSFRWKVWGETSRKSGQLYKIPQSVSELLKGAMPDWDRKMEKEQNTLCVTPCVYNIRAENAWGYFFPCFLGFVFFTALKRVRQTGTFQTPVISHTHN